MILLEIYHFGNIVALWFKFWWWCMLDKNSALQNSFCAEKPSWTLYHVHSILRTEIVKCWNCNLLWFDVDEYCSFSLLVEMSSVRTLKGPSTQIRCINRIKGCHQCKFFQEIQSFTGIKRCHQHQSFPGLEMRFGETLFNLIHAPQTNVQIFSGTDIHWNGC